MLFSVAAAGFLPAQTDGGQPAVAASAAQGPDDKKTQEALQAVFGQVRVFADITVSVQAGVVALSGKAPASTVRDSAAAVAKGMPGVLYVDNQIELPAPDAAGGSENREAPSALDQSLAERLRSIFARFERLSAVEIRVAAGVVELRGQVVNSADRATAEQLAKSIDGVVFVSNQVTETKDIAKRILPSVEKMVGWARDFVVMLPLLLVAAIIVIFFWWLGRWLAGIDRAFVKMTDNKLVQDILRQVTKTLVILLGVFLALEILGATALVGAVLGTAGIVGLALGFAFRDIVENYLASIILSVRQPFRSKDLVEIDGNRGTVIHLTTRDTVLLTAEGNHLTLPNATVFKSTIVNFTRAPQRRFDVAVGVGSDVDLTEAIELGLGVLRQMNGVVADPAPFARVENLGDSTVSLRFYGWVDQRSAEYSKVLSEAVRFIKGVMDENQIDMPVPMYQVELRRTDGNATNPTPGKNTATAHEQAAAADVALDGAIERQVDEELARTGEVDLLEKHSKAAATRSGRDDI